MRRPGLVMGALLALSCGGSLATSEGSSMDGGSGDAAFADPCRPAGARICAPEQGCAALGAACPGAGCTNVDTLAGGATPDGVCWSDLADLGDVACASCDDGQSCIRRGSVLRCVPNEVCHAFWALGIRNVCTYADKHVYDDRLLPPEPTSCPATTVPGSGVLCGGACASCRPDQAQRCVGRSPDHPVGICEPLNPQSDVLDPATYPTCSIVSGQYVRSCEGSWVCGVFYSDAPTDTVIAKQYGLCMQLDACTNLANSLPGGFGCYGAQATLVAGR